jgi:nitronate monooxygenase
MLKTRITEMLGIEYPIICGGMQYVSNAELVAAVSNAGGMGMLAVGNFGSKGELRDEIRKIKTLTDKPFGVNVTFMPVLEFVDREGMMDTAIEEGVSAFETSGRISEEHVQRIKRGNAKHIHKVARVRDARTAERLGVDAVAIVGFECGGAPPMDDITTFIQVPLVVNAINVPVIAGGGIGDARGLVAALALGAEGVVMGTHFMATRESLIHSNAKEAMVNAKETDTICVMRSLGTMERVFKNEVSKQVVEMEKKGATLEELVPLITGKKVREAFETGNLHTGILPCGQITGLINEVATVKEVIDDMVSGADDILNRLTRMIRAG